MSRSALENASTESDQMLKDVKTFRREAWITATAHFKEGAAFDLFDWLGGGFGIFGAAVLALRKLEMLPNGTPKACPFPETLHKKLVPLQTKIAPIIPCFSRVFLYSAVLCFCAHQVVHPRHWADKHVSEGSRYNILARSAAELERELAQGTSQHTVEATGRELQKKRARAEKKYHTKIHDRFYSLARDAAKRKGL